MKKKLKIMVMALLLPVLIASSEQISLPSTSKIFSQIVPKPIDLYMS